jgi:hypothetical protein
MMIVAPSFDEWVKVYVDPGAIHIESHCFTISHIASTTYWSATGKLNATQTANTDMITQHTASCVRH